HRFCDEWRRGAHTAGGLRGLSREADFHCQVHGNSSQLPERRRGRMPGDCSLVVGVPADVKASSSTVKNRCEFRQNQLPEFATFSLKNLQILDFSQSTLSSLSLHLREGPYPI